MKKTILLFLLFYISYNSTAQSWSQLGTVSTNAAGDNGSICVARDPSSGTLYTAGYFKNSGGYNYVAKWNGTSWTELGTGSNSLNANNSITSIVVDNNGNVYASGYFKNTNGSPYVAKWDGTSWSELGTINANNSSSILNLTIDHSGNIYAAGIVNPISSSYNAIKKWDGTSWSLFGTESNSIGFIRVAVTSDTLYAAVGDNSGYYIVKWDGTNWTKIGNKISGESINAMITDDAGNLYAGGYLNSGTNYRDIAKWNGYTWTTLGTNALKASDFVRSLAIDSFGNLYAAGEFEDAYNSVYVAKWNGTTWSELGGLTHSIPNNHNAYSCNRILEIISDEAGNIYAGGSFVDTNGNHYIAKWTSGITTSAMEQSYTNVVSLYPNPTNSQVNITLPEDGQINVYNSSGKLVTTQQATIGLSSIDLSNFTSGIYTLLFNGQNTSYAPVKLVKE